MSLTKIRARFAVTLPRVTMFLLVGAGLATSVVVYQAYQAQRSQRETVARALAEYGAFASGSSATSCPKHSSSAGPATAGDGWLGPDRPGPPSLEEFAGTRAQRDVPCRCTSGHRGRISIRRSERVFGYGADARASSAGSGTRL